MFPETPSINRVLPVITPKNFLLTSRGRVVYGLLTVDKHNDCTNEYLSDEFRQAVAGKAINYSESDVEKVKIDSFSYKKLLINEIRYLRRNWLKVSIEFREKISTNHIHLHILSCMPTRQRSRKALPKLIYRNFINFHFWYLENENRYFCFQPSGLLKVLQNSRKGSLNITSYSMLHSVESPVKRQLKKIGSEKVLWRLMEIEVLE